MTYLHLIVLLCRLGLAAVSGGRSVREPAVAVSAGDCAAAAECDQPVCPDPCQADSARSVPGPSALHQVAERVAAVWPLDLAVDVLQDGYHEVLAVEAEWAHARSFAVRVKDTVLGEDRPLACGKPKATAPAFRRLIQRMCT